MDNKNRPKFEPSQKNNFGHKPEPTRPRPPAPPSQRVIKRAINEEYVELIESSNRQHSAICDYIEAHGADERLQVHVQGTYYWLRMIAERNGFDL